MYSEHEIKSGNTNIVLSVWEAKEAIAVIVFIPGTMVHPLYYETLLEEFRKCDFTVVGVHPVGHGKSPRDVKRYTINDIVRNGRDAVTFALERYSLPVIVFGSSQGGLVAAAIAAEDERIAAAFAHNLLMAELPETIGVSSFPKWLRHIYRLVVGVFKFFAKLFPDLSLPPCFYMDKNRISADPEIWEKVNHDELCLTHYSLHFLSSLFTTYFPGLTDGSIRCPVYVITDTGDELFPIEYINLVFERLNAPHKEMITFDYNDHMIMVTHPKDVCEKVSAIMRGLISNENKR
jgi:pimeloyl-ACP methyl ester carboxylesterase